MTNVQIEGLSRIAKKLERVGSDTALMRPMKQSVAHMHRTIARYPPATAANSPGRVDRLGRPMAWYVRGRGTMYPSGAVRMISETLGRRWTERVEQRGRRGVVGNNASYVRYVQDEDKQAQFHTRRGWLTAQDATEQESDTILNFFRNEYKRILNR